MKEETLIYIPQNIEVKEFEKWPKYLEMFKYQNIFCPFLPSGKIYVPKFFKMLLILRGEVDRWKEREREKEW